MFERLSDIVGDLIAKTLRESCPKLKTNKCAAFQTQGASTCSECYDFWCDGEVKEAIINFQQEPISAEELHNLLGPGAVGLIDSSSGEGF